MSTICVQTSFRGKRPVAVQLFCPQHSGMIFTTYLIATTSQLTLTNVYYISNQVTGANNYLRTITRSYVSAKTCRVLPADSSSTASQSSSTTIDELLRWDFRQAVLTNMKGAGEPIFEDDFPPGSDMIGEIL